MAYISYSYLVLLSDDSLYIISFITVVVVVVLILLMNTDVVSSWYSYPICIDVVVVLFSFLTDFAEGG